MKSKNKIDNEVKTKLLEDQLNLQEQISSKDYCSEFRGGRENEESKETKQINFIELTEVVASQSCNV